MGDGSDTIRRLALCCKVRDSCTFGAAPLRGRLVGVAQSVRAPDCGSGGRRCDSGRPPSWPETRQGRRWHASAVRRELLTRSGDSGTVQVYCVSAGTLRSGMGPVPRRGIRGTGRRMFRLGGVSCPPGSCLTIEVMRSGRAPNAGGYCVSPVFARVRTMVVRTSDGFDNADSEQGIRRDPLFIRAVQAIYHGEFDPGSGRTLAACFIHASRTRTGCLHLEPSGERVSNT